MKRLIYLNVNLNFIKDNYGIFNGLKILINSFLKSVKSKDEQIKW